MNDGVRGTESALANLLEEHPAVAQALVTEGVDRPGSTAWIVPDQRHAPMLHRSAAIEEAGRLGALAWHEPADGLWVAGFSRGETAFLYREIFAGDAYFRNGLELPENAVVVDVGANIGMFTLRVARERPNARIVAIEPVAELAEAVRINAELHDAAVIVLGVAAGDADTESDFTFYPGNSVMSGCYGDAEEDVAVLKGYLLTGEGAEDDGQLDRLAADLLVGEHRRVPVRTLAGIAAEHGLDRIDLLKIDVEKAEMEVLAGVDEALWPRVERVVVEVHDIDGRLDAVLKLLTDRGFVVESEQDPRLVLTPCHTVYADRPRTAGHAPASTATVTADRGPTLGALERDLRRLIADRRPATEPPKHFALVSRLAKVDDVPSPESTGRTTTLARAWTDLFGAGTARPDADFFELGGTSLAALRLVDRVGQEAGPGLLTAELIFALGTFGELAKALETGER